MNAQHQKARLKMQETVFYLALQSNHSPSNKLIYMAVKLKLL